jgi:hypothetical protein
MTIGISLLVSANDAVATTLSKYSLGFGENLIQIRKARAQDDVLSLGDQYIATLDIDVRAECQTNQDTL